MSQQAPAMSLPTPHQSAPKRPRLSLQTSVVKSGTVLKADIDPTSATAFNTLSNAYAAAIELSSPKVGHTPPSAGLKNAASDPRRSKLRLVTTSDDQKKPLFPSQRTQTPGPFTVAYPDTPTAIFSPLKAHPVHANSSSFTFTPPQSAHPSDEKVAKAFQYTTRFGENASPVSPRTPRRRATIGVQSLWPPYTHPRALHSILRNSPLPPRSSLTPMSPTRSSRRLADRAAKKLAFNTPLTQTITTQRYVRSHVELLAEEASPFTPTDPEAGTLETLDLALAYTGDETRYGGQTPGPFEEMRLRMAGLEAESDSEKPGNKKRKRKEKKRQWVWTIGSNEDDSPIPLDKTPVSVTQVELPNLEDQTLHDAIEFHSEEASQEAETTPQMETDQPNQPMQMEM